MEGLPEIIYPLTSLQIGDIQSYLSRIYLYFSSESNKLLILVDNRPWLLMNKHSKSIILWQLMVTKYRVSPFTNSRKPLKSPDPGDKLGRNGSFDSTRRISDTLRGWFAVTDAVKWQDKALYRLMNLCETLHGFIVFEVSWEEVCGINYLNELQTDTSVVLEVKSMKKWEFNGIEQALTCISSWFSGTISEAQSLQHSLNWLSEVDTPADCPFNFPISSVDLELPFHEKQLLQAFSEDIYFDAQECPVKTEKRPDFLDGFKGYNDINYLKTYPGFGATLYGNTLLQFRFSNRDLPFKLRQIITSNLRLLTLLESGLPAWVIFIQSYPLFCQFYRPWMCPLARTLYILISLVTVLIGFYDLYKNVPILKVTVARLFGPLFDWIEAWDMISRIKYIGTMLFLQNSEIAVKWFLSMMHAFRPLVSLLTKPLTGPFLETVEFLLPIWNVCVDTGEMFCSSVWAIVESSCGMVVDLIDILLNPFELLLSFISTIVTSVIFPVCSSFRDLIVIPIRFGTEMAKYLASLMADIFYLLKDVWWSVNGIVQLNSASETNAAYKISFWHSLWNDLFSQIFRAIRSILNGFIAFFTSCNRHRLSIYNHTRELPHRFCRRLSLAHPRRQNPVRISGLFEEKTA